MRDHTTKQHHLSARRSKLHVSSARSSPVNERPPALIRRKPAVTVAQFRAWRGSLVQLSSVRMSAYNNRRATKKHTSDFYACAQINLKTDFSIFRARSREDVTRARAIKQSEGSRFAMPLALQMNSGHETGRGFKASSAKLLVHPADFFSATTLTELELFFSR